MLSVNAFAQDKALELKSGTVVAADGTTIQVEAGSALLGPRTLLATSRRITDCETARRELELESHDSSTGAVIIVVLGILAAGSVGYLVGHASR